MIELSLIDFYLCFCAFCYSLF
nr:truncated ORF7b [Severe acute respiratory syndrome coronavirus 2]